MNINRNTRFSIFRYGLLIYLTACPRIGVGGDTLQISGYYKNFLSGFDSPLPGEPTIGAVNNRLRVDLMSAVSHRLSFDLSYNLAPRVQDASLFGKGTAIVAIDPLRYRVTDLKSPIFPDEDDPIGSFGLFQNLDRASMTISADFADIYIGRQAIAWGSARVINPTDVVAPFTYEELDTEDRIGVDAIRVRAPIGALGEFDIGGIFGDDFAFAQSAFFLRGQLNAVETDISTLLLGFRENLLLGLDLARGIGGAGFWFEAAYVFPSALADDTGDEAESYLRASIGLDYSFGGETYGFIEYHFNQAGAKEPENYLNNLTQPAYTDAGTYLLGRHYLAPGVVYQITPLIALTAQTLFNVTDPSILLSPQLEYNIAQDIYLSVGAFIGAGNRPETVDDAEQFRSEFGGYPDIFFTSFRIYY